MAPLRSQENLWDTVAVGSNGISSAFNVGSQTNVVVFVKSSAITNITLLVSPGTGGAGRNSNPEDDQFYNLLKDDGSAIFTFALTAGQAVAIDLSPFAPQYIKLQTSAAATLTAGVAAS